CALQHLACRIAGQSRSVHYAAGDFVVRQVLSEKSKELFFVGFRAFLYSHEGDGLLASARMWNTDHGCLLHSRKTIDDLFKLAGIDIDPVYEEHVLFAVGDEVVPIRIAITNIARKQPAIANSCARLFRLVPIPPHYVSTADANLSRFASL